MNVLNLLKTDHEKIKSYCEEVEASNDIKKRKELFDKIKFELGLHTAVEETYFYSKLEAVKDARDMTLEAYQEHRVVEEILVDLEDMSMKEEDWIARFKVMTENLTHHIEEEESDLFDEAKKLFTKEEMDEIGNSIQKVKEAEIEERK